MLTIQDFCKTLGYKNYVWACYYNAKKIQRNYGGELYYDGDHVRVYKDGKLYDHEGEHTELGRYIILDSLSEKRLLETFTRENIVNDI